MTSNNPSGPRADEKSVSISSPPKALAHPASSSKAPKPLSGTGLPAVVNQPYPIFTAATDDTQPIGNRQFEFMMTQLGHFGHFLPRDRKAVVPTQITLSRDTLEASMFTVLSAVLERLITKKGHIHQHEIAALAATNAQHLAKGCMLMIYMKLRTLHRSFPATYQQFLLRPHVPEPFEVPVPYALAIQSLGLFRVSSKTHEEELMPTVPAASLVNFMTGTPALKLPQYQSAVEFAKSLGMRFQTVDLSVKLGSAWWLFKPILAAENFQLQCCLPEDNYTNEDAVLRALYCMDTGGNLHSEIADLRGLTMNRGSFIRNPPQDIAITCFNGCMEDSPDSWSLH